MNIASLKNRIKNDYRFSLCLMALISFSCLSLQATSYNITVVKSGLNAPFAIAAASNDVLYFSEIPNDYNFSYDPTGEDSEIKKLDLTTGNVTSISNEGNSATPYSISVADDGSVYWTDASMNESITKYINGVKTNVTPAQNFGFSTPVGVYAASDGYLYYCELPDFGDIGTNTVSRILSCGQSIPERIADRDPSPWDVAVSDSGDVYSTSVVGAIIKRRVDSIDAEGMYYVPWDTEENGELDSALYGLAINDDDTKLYFAQAIARGDLGNTYNKVGVIDIATKAVTIIKEGDAEPIDITVSPNGNVYWTCRTTGQIFCATPINP